MRDTGYEKRGVRLASYLVTCISVLALGACGFHLRGAVALPEAMARTQLRGVEMRGDLGLEIRSVLREAGAKVVAADEPAGSVLEITGDRFDRRVSSVDSSGKATQYELRYVLDGMLRDSGGGVLVPGKRATVVRLLNSEANALGTASEEELLRREMQRDAVRQLIRQVRTALERMPAPSASSTP